MVISSRFVGIMLQISLLLYSEFSSKSPKSDYFYAASFINIPNLQFKLPIKVSHLSYLTPVEPLQSIHFTFINAFIVYPEL